MDGNSEYALLSYAGQIASTALNAAFQASTSRSDRKWQEKMYQRQLEDNRENWRMLNEYNSPSAQMERLAAAGLNPHLVYGSGAVASSPTMPNSSQTSPNYRSPIKMDLDILGPYIALRKLDNETALTKQQVNESKAREDNYVANSAATRWQTDFNESVKEVKQNLLYADYRRINSSIQQMDNQVLNANRITDSQLETMAQARFYQIQQFNLSAFEVGQRIKQGWANVANGRIQASAAMQSAAAAALNASTNAHLSEWQIGNMAIDILNKTKQGKKIDAETLSINTSTYGKEVDNWVKEYDAYLRNAGVGNGSNVWDNIAGPFLTVPIVSPFGLGPYTGGGHRVAPPPNR